jgi:hypothetical protein
MREAGDDLAAGLPGVGVVPAPKGVCLYPAYAARVAAPRDDRDAGAAGGLPAERAFAARRAAEIEGYAVDHQHDETPFPPIR